MSSLSSSERRDVVQFLNDAEASISGISMRAEAGDADVDDLLLEAEALLRDVTLMSELFPEEEGESLLRAVADVYL